MKQYLYTLSKSIFVLSLLLSFVEASHAQDQDAELTEKEKVPELYIKDEEGNFISLGSDYSTSGEESIDLDAGETDGFQCAAAFRFCDRLYPDSYWTFNHCMKTFNC